MEKTIVIAGKDLPVGTDFASSVSVKNRTAIVSASENADISNALGYTAVPWNRPSALSARSLILTCLNVSSHIDEAVLIFDESQFATEYPRTDATEKARVLDDLIIGYQYLTDEILARFEQKKMRSDETSCGKLVFLYKANPGQSDATQNPALRSANTLSSPLVSAAGAAFKTYAENIAALHAENECVYPVLVTADSSMEIAHRDNTLASWLCDYLDAVDALKKRPAPKQLISWIKAGAKKPGGFFS